MKIVVLVKYVPDATGERGFAADATVDREAADGLLSELDERAQSHPDETGTDEGNATPST